MIDVNDLKNCCGCMACQQVCPTGAISEGTDKNGFVVPQIDAQKCVSCGACDKVCAFRREKNSEQNVKRAYGFQLGDKDALLQSTSGGAFTALSDVVLQDGGVICGAVADEGLTVRHCFADDKSGRDAMRMSKYVQSSTAGVFERVKELLSDGKKVMFVGTPCQTAQLRRYVGESAQGLLCCDFLCHGVPGQEFFNAHIRYLEKKFRKKAVSYNFRGKRYGWNHGIEEIVFSDGSHKDNITVQSFSRFFQGGMSLRDSCRNCKYRSLHRFSDVTIADFWGLEKAMGITDRYGYSLIFVNSEAGLQWVQSLQSAGKLSEVPLEKVLYRISVEPSKSRVEPEKFWEAYHSGGYEGVAARYAKASASDALKLKIKQQTQKLK